MRKLTIAIIATAAMLFSGSLVWKAKATTPGSDANIPAANKNLSPVVKAACREHGAGARCRLGTHWVCGPNGHCGCAPC